MWGQLLMVLLSVNVKEVECLKYAGFFQDRCPLAQQPATYTTCHAWHLTCYFCRQMPPCPSAIHLRDTGCPQGWHRHHGAKARWGGVESYLSWGSLFWQQKQFLIARKSARSLGSHSVLQWLKRICFKEIDRLALLLTDPPSGNPNPLVQWWKTYSGTAVI